MPDIFLSYSREDQPTARRYAEGLQREGFSVWWDQALHPGEDFDEVTEKALEEAKAVVVLWSKTSVSSRWVRAEATQANAANKLVPVMIEECKRPIMFELKHTAELAGWKGGSDDPAWQAFVASLRRFPISTVSDAPAPLHNRRSRRPASTRRLVFGFLMAVLLVAGGAAYWLVGGTHAGSAAGQGAVTLAVLPFANLSSDPEQEYFSDGLTEEILNQLSQVQDLRVTARTSSFAFKGKREDSREVGRQLGVAHILEGSVRKSGQKLRITAQLIDVQSDSQIWSQTYERELKDVFAIQDEIATAVTGALSVKLDVGAMARSRGGTTNLEAYDRYLRAKSLDQQHSGDMAAAWYREAVKLDPSFISAWSGLYYDLASALMYATSADAIRTEMQQVGTRVQQIAPDSWQAQVILAGQLVDGRRWVQAEQALEKARAAGADFASVSGAAGPSITHGGIDTLFLWNTGRISEAVAVVQRRREADPLSLSASDAWQTMLLLANRQDEADAEYMRVKPLEGDHRSMESMNATRRMMRAQADPAIGRDYMQAVVRRMQPSAPALKLPEGRIDDRTALAVFRAVIDNPATTSGEAIYAALFAGYLRDKQLSLAAFRRAYVDLHGPDIFYLWFPFWDNLRTEPEFKAIVRDLGLVDYWRQSNNWGDFCKPTTGDDFECH